MSTESDDEQIKQIKKEGYGPLWERFKFAAGNWTLTIIGGLVLLFAWLNYEPPPEPWKSDISKLMVGMILYGMVLYYFYMRNMRKLERRIGWPEMMLRAVKGHAEDMRKASIDEAQTLGDMLEDALRKASRTDG